MRRVVLAAALLVIAAAAQAGPRTLLDTTNGEAEATVKSDSALAAEPAFQKLVDGAALQNARSFLREHRREKLQYKGMKNGYSSKATVDFAGAEYMSVVRIIDLFTGGAHGNPGLATGMWDRAADRALDAGDILASFKDDSPAMRLVAEYVRSDLERQMGNDVQRDMLNDGTAPKLANYSAITFAAATSGDKPAGIIVHFPPYAVASYAEGYQAVIIPAEVLRPHLAPRFRDAFAGTPKPLPPRE